MEFDNPVEEIRRGILVFPEFHPRAEEDALRHETVQADILAVDDGLNEALVDGLVHLRPIGLNEGLGVPVEHAPDADEGVFRVRVGRIAGGAVAPCFPPADEVQRGDDALPVQVVRFVGAEDDFRAVGETGAGDLHGLVGRRFVGDVSVVAVDGGHDAEEMDGHMEDVVAVPHHGPADHFLLVGVIEIVLPCGHVGVLRDGVRRRVGKDHGLEMAVDAAGLGGHDGGHGGLVAPPGREDEAGHETVQGENLIQRLEAGIGAGGHVHAADDVVFGNGGGVELVVGCVEGPRIVRRAVFEGGDDEPAGAVVGGFVIGALHEGRPFPALVFHHEGGEEHRIREDAFVLRHGDFRIYHAFFVLRRVEDVHEDDGRAVVQGKLAVHRFAEGVIFPVFAVAEGRDGFGVAVAQDGPVRRGGVAREMDRRSAEDDRQPRRGIHRGHDAGGHFRRIDAMLIGHDQTSFACS